MSTMWRRTIQPDCKLNWHMDNSHAILFSMWPRLYTYEGEQAQYRKARNSTDLVALKKTTNNGLGFGLMGKLLRIAPGPHRLRISLEFLLLWHLGNIDWYTDRQKKATTTSNTDNSESKNAFYYTWLMPTKLEINLHYLLKFHWNVTKFVATIKSETRVRSKSKFQKPVNVFCLVIQHLVYPPCTFTQAVCLLLMELTSLWETAWGISTPSRWRACSRSSGCERVGQPTLRWW